MSGFGGAVKLTGESEYRKALSQITQNLKEVSSQMQVVSSEFGKNDKSVEALSAKSKVLNDRLNEQNNKLSVLQKQYSAMDAEFQKQTKNHESLVKSYNNEKSKLEEIGRTLGTTSKEYQDQKAVVEQLANEVRKSTQNQDANAKSMSNMRIEINKAQAECNKTAKELDDLGDSAEEAGEDAEEAGDGFTVFKGVLANLASTAITAAVDGLKKLAGALVDVGKQAIGNYAAYEQLVGGVETLFGDSADIVQEYAQNAYKTAGMSANEYMETVTSFSASLLQGLEGDTATAAKAANTAIVDMSDNANKMGTSIASIQNAYQGFAKQNYTMLDNLKLGYGGTASEMARLINESGVLNKAQEDNSEEAARLNANLEALKKKYAEMGVELQAQSVRHNQVSSEYKKAITELDEIGAKSGETSKAYQKQAEKVEKLGQKLAASTEAMNASKLAIDRTKTGIKDAQKAVDNLGAATVITADTVKDVPFDKIIEAIHVVQTEIGITGTTSKEAASTIEGSGGSMRAAWQNVLTGIADTNQEIAPLIEAFVETASSAAENYLPRISAVVDGLVELFTVVWNETLPKIAEHFPALQGVVDFFNWIKENGTAIETVLAAITAGFVAFKAAAVMTKAITAFQTLFSVLQSGQGIMAALNTIMAANPIGLIVTAVAALVAGFVVLWNKSEDFRNFWINLWETVKGAVDSAIQWIVQAWNDITEFFVGIVTWFNDNVIVPIVEFFKNLWVTVSGFFVSLWNDIVKVWETVTTWFDDNIIQPLVKFFKGLWDSVSGFFVSLWNDIVKVWQAVTGWFDKNIIQPLVKFFKGLWDGIVYWFHTIIDPWIEIARRAFLLFKDKVIDPLVKWFTKLWDTVKNAAIAAWNFIKGVWIAVSSWFNANVVQPLVNFFVSLWTAIKNAASAAWNFIKGVWVAVSGWFKNYVINPVVNFFVGLWNALKNGASAAWNGIKNVWNVVKTWFSNNVIAPVKNFFKGMWDGLKTGAKNAWQGIKDVFGKVKDWFKDKFSQAWQAVKNVFSTGGRIFTGIKDGIVSAFKTVVNAIIRGINTVVAVPFNAINGFLNMLRNINILGIAPFGWIQNIGVPQIPLLAKGGVLDKGARLVEAGEDGAEAIVPLEHNTEWIKKVAGELKTALIDANSMRTGIYPMEQAKEDKSMVRAFKEALSQMKIELDDEVAGKFVERTVTRVVYQ